MANFLIVGGGIAALFCQAYFSKEDGILIAPKSYTGSRYKLRPKLCISKLLGKRTSSWGSLLFKLTKSRLHDVNMLGGNSNYWGGFFDKEGFTEEELSPLLSCGIKLVPLSLLETGSRSRCDTLHQMQNSNGKILNSSDYLNVHIDGYVESIKLNGSGFDYWTIDHKVGPSAGVAHKIFLCVGVVQLMDLMHRSGLLVEGDILTMTEYKHGIRFDMKNPAKIKSNTNSKSLSIYYDFFRAINHYLGIQKSTLLWGGFPVAIEQTFFSEIIELKLELKGGGFLTEISERKFGGSIHYCNLKINGLPVRQYLADLWPGVEVFGMATINQIKPGPISNEILRDILKVIHGS